MQSSSQSFPIDISEPDFNSSKTCPSRADCDNEEGNGRVADCFAVIVSPFATVTRGPVVVFSTFVHCDAPDFVR
jgi:hypothetical protein